MNVIGQILNDRPLENSVPYLKISRIFWRQVKDLWPFSSEKVGILMMSVACCSASCVFLWDLYIGYFLTSWREWVDRLLRRRMRPIRSQSRWQSVSGLCEKSQTQRDTVTNLIQYRVKLQDPQKSAGKSRRTAVKFDPCLRRKMSKRTKPTTPKRLKRVSDAVEARKNGRDFEMQIDQFRILPLLRNE